jgi:hypothetical protein
MPEDFGDWKYRPSTHQRDFSPRGLDLLILRTQHHNRRKAAQSPRCNRMSSSGAIAKV